MPALTARDMCLRQYSWECPIHDPSDAANIHIAKRYSKLHNSFIEWQFDRYVALWEDWTAFIDSWRSAYSQIPPNTAYSPRDSLFLYCAILHFKPKRVVEVGSGYSSFTANLAIQELRGAGHNTAHSCIDPYRSNVLDQISRDIRIHKARVQEADFDVFDSLEANDILFLDTSHVTTAFGDTLLEFLWILPRLRPGVIVHVHDVFLPWNYPAEWLPDRPYTEQWVLAAFLHNNKDWEILWPAYLMGRERPSLFVDVGDDPAGSFWIRKSDFAGVMRDAPS